MSDTAEVKRWGRQAALELLAEICGMTLLFGVIVAPVNHKFSRWIDHNSKIVFGEDLVQSIPAEFVRRSALFRQSWERYRACVGVPACDNEVILADREQAITLDWSNVYERLEVFDDWEPSAARDSFFAERIKEGEEFLRTHCRPKIEFTNMPEPFMTFQGFVCEKAPAS